MINNQHSIHTFSMGQFVWWEGVVESRDDPEKLGRVQIRMIGYHSDDKSDIPTEDLFWTTQSQSILSAGVSGVGYSATGIVEGTHCWGFFRDGHNAQLPVVVGVYAGIPAKQAETSKGFNDPNGKYPKSDMVGESDQNRLARAEKIDETIVQTKNDSRDLAVPIAFGGTWDEPESPYDAKYPFNHVHESESGHVFEIDDTEGQERIHQWHRKGTYEEIDKDGSIVTKTVKDRYAIIMGDDYVHIMGDTKVTIGGNANILVQGNTNLQTQGNHKEEVAGNYDVKVGGTYSVQSGGRMSFTAPRIDLN